MRYIVYTFLMVSVLYGCKVSNSARYTAYRNNLMFGTTPSSTAYRLVPVKICQQKKDSIVFAINDLQHLKSKCYDSLTPSEFNAIIGKSLFDGKKCFTRICDSNLVLQTNLNTFKNIEALGVNGIKKRYFLDGRSKSVFSGNKPSDDILAALVILFYENYILHWGDDEHIYIKRAPENSEMDKLLNYIQRE